MGKWYFGVDGGVMTAVDPEITPALADARMTHFLEASIVGGVPANIDVSCATNLHTSKRKFKNTPHHTPELTGTKYATMYAVGSP